MPRNARTILVVDDEEMILKFVSLVLKRTGFRVLSASGDAAALKLCQDGAETIDLAVLDIVMPRMDGSPLCLQLRDLYPNLRVLFMSGCNQEEVSRRLGRAVEADEFLKKPFTAAELLARVHQIVERPHTFHA